MILTGTMIIAIVSFAFLMNSETESTTSLFARNLDALADNESGSICTGGCKRIGWGWDKILMCNCDYTGTFSTCDEWGCM